MSKLKNQPRKQKMSHTAGRPDQQHHDMQAMPEMHEKAAMADARATARPDEMNNRNTMQAKGAMPPKKAMHAKASADTPTAMAHKKEKRFGHN